MTYELKYEGLSPDEVLEERLLLQCRRLVMATDAKSNVQFMVRQIEGNIQVRVEVVFSGRRLSVVVWRNEPVTALTAAIDATLDAVDFNSMKSFVATDLSGPMALASNHL